MSTQLLDGRRQFASDNYAGICPEAFAAMVEANQGHEVSYGDDTWTAKASNLIRDIFETDCECSSCSTAPRPTRFRWPRSALPPVS
jgi:threonine aldolase